MAELALTGQNLTKAFGGIVAVGGINIGLRSGEIVGVLGPNGSGKTTLMSMLAGLVRPDGGSVRIVDRDVTRAAPYSAKRRDVACALQNPRLFGSLTLRENLELSLYIKRRHGASAGASIDEVLERVGLAGSGRLPASSLSGGQRKLADLARALIASPRILLADEPTAGVSRAGQELVTATLQRVAGAGMAVLLVSHDLPWTFQLCNRVLFLRAGEVLVEGAASEVQHDPRIAEAYLR